MTFARTAAACAAVLMLAAPVAAQSAAPPGQGPIDISADNSQLLETEGRIVYSGDVNVVRGGVRLRADRLEAVFERRQGGGFGDLQRILASGEVFYVTAEEIARGDAGEYDLVENTIVLNGSVVLTQGCNVSTGERLDADLDAGIARLTGGSGGAGRVRSVFFTDDSGRPTMDGQDCPQPTVPGRGPRPFTGDG